VADVDVAGGKETVALVEEHGADGLFVATDVGRADELAGLIAAATDSYGGFDILHNNAGLVSGNPPWPSTPVARIEEGGAGNGLGVLVGTRLAVDVLRARGGGAIVNPASVTGQ